MALSLTSNHGAKKKLIRKKIPPRRWVVKRTIASLKGFRGIRTWYCRYLSSFEASVRLACAIIIFRKIKKEAPEQF